MVWKLVRRLRTAGLERGASLFEVLIVCAVILASAIAIVSNLPQARAQGQVTGCVQNLKAIQSALETYNAATQTYPSGTAVAVTTGLLTNPTVSTVNYLGQTPIDPADPTHAASYTYTYVAPTATTAGDYTIECPGLHAKETLSSYTGGATETSGHLFIDEAKNIYTQ